MSQTNNTTIFQQFTTHKVQKDGEMVEDLSQFNNQKRKRNKKELLKAIFYVPYQYKQITPSCTIKVIQIAPDIISNDYLILGQTSTLNNNELTKSVKF